MAAKLPVVEIVALQQITLCSSTFVVFIKYYIFVDLEILE